MPLEEIQKQLKSLEDKIDSSHLAISKVQSNGLSDVYKQLRDVNLKVEEINGIGWLPKQLKTNIGFILSVITVAIPIIAFGYSLKSDISILQDKVLNIFMTVSDANKTMKEIQLTKEKAHEDFNTRISTIEGFMRKLGL